MYSLRNGERSRGLGLLPVLDDGYHRRGVGGQPHFQDREVSLSVGAEKLQEVAQSSQSPTNESYLWQRIWGLRKDA
ncbi:hypothetical protein ACFX12_027332 [Malus domestica]